MKTSPASVHFRAKAEFSLNYLPSILALRKQLQIRDPYKSIARVNALATLPLRDLNDTVSIKIC